MSGPQELFRRNRSGAVNQQVAFIAQPYSQPGESTRSRTVDLLPLLIELAAVARARNDVQIGIPDCQASEVRANRRERIKALGAVYHVYASLNILGHGADRVAV